MVRWWSGGSPGGWRRLAQGVAMPSPLSSRLELPVEMAVGRLTAAGDALTRFEVALSFNLTAAAGVAVPRAPAGVIDLPEGMGLWPILLEAAADAPLAHGELHVRAEFAARVRLRRCARRDACSLTHRSSRRSG